MMTRILVSVAAVCFVPGFVFGAEALAFAKPDVVPAPVSVTVVSNAAVRLDARCAWTVTCPDPAAGPWIADHAERWFGVRPKVSSVRADALASEPDGASAMPKSGRISRFPQRARHGARRRRAETSDAIGGRWAGI